MKNDKAKIILPCNVKVLMDSEIFKEIFSEEIDTIYPNGEDYFYLENAENYSPGVKVLFMFIDDVINHRARATNVPISIVQTSSLKFIRRELKIINLIIANPNKTVNTHLFERFKECGTPIGCIIEPLI